MEWGWQTFFQLLVLIGGSSVLGVAIKGFLERKKINVDAGAALSNAALAQVAESNKRADAAQDRMDEMSSDIMKLRTALRDHDKWDRMVVRKLHQQGIDVDPPPEIWVL